MCFRMSQKTKVAKSAEEPKLQGLLAENAPAATYPCVENSGGLITADHEVLREECESRNNHRYAVIVPDLSTQWLQADPCKTKVSEETVKSLQKFFGPKASPIVVYTDNSVDDCKAREDLRWNIIENHRLIVPRRMVLQSGQYAG